MPGASWLVRAHVCSSRLDLKSLPHGVSRWKNIFLASALSSMYTYKSSTYVTCLSYMHLTQTHKYMGKYYKHTIYALVYSSVYNEQIQKYSDTVFLHTVLFIHSPESRWIWDSIFLQSWREISSKKEIPCDCYQWKFTDAKSKICWWVKSSGPSFQKTKQTSSFLDICSKYVIAVEKRSGKFLKWSMVIKNLLSWPLSKQPFGLQTCV